MTVPSFKHVVAIARFSFAPPVLPSLGMVEVDIILLIVILLQPHPRVSRVKILMAAYRSGKERANCQPDPFRVGG